MSASDFSPLTLTRTVDATVEPVTLAEARAHLRIDSNDEDTLITTLITVARSIAEDWTDRQFITATWTLSLDQFPGSYGTILLPRPRLISISSVTYVDTAGATQTMTASDYRVDSTSQPGRLEPAYGTSWPTARCVTNAVTITFTAGYGAAASAVPAPIKQAILMILSDLFENRESAVTGTIVSPASLTAKALLGPHRVMTVY